MKTLLQKLFLLFLTLCFLCGCESDPLASRPWIKGYASRSDNYNPSDYTELGFDAYVGLCITNAEEEPFNFNGDYLCDDVLCLYYGNMKLYNYSFMIGRNSHVYIEVLSSRYYLFEYSKLPANRLEAEALCVSAPSITKAVLFQSGTAVLDGDLSEFEVSYQCPDNTDVELCLTGSGKDHVEVRYENDTLIAEGEEVEYSVTEEAA